MDVVLASAPAIAFLGALARATNKAQAFSCKQSIAEKPF